MILAHSGVSRREPGYQVRRRRTLYRDITVANQMVKVTSHAVLSERSVELHADSTHHSMSRTGTYPWAGIHHIGRSSGSYKL